MSVLVLWDLVLIVSISTFLCIPQIVTEYLQHGSGKEDTVYTWGQEPSFSTFITLSTASQGLFSKLWRLEIQNKGLPGLVSPKTSLFDLKIQTYISSQVVPFPSKGRFSLCRSGWPQTQICLALAPTLNVYFIIFNYRYLYGNVHIRAGTHRVRRCQIIRPGI